MYRKGKSAAFKIIDSDADLEYLDIFKDENASHEDIKAAGETLLLSIYTASSTIGSLDELRHEKYKKQVAKKSITSGTWW